MPIPTETQFADYPRRHTFRGQGHLWIMGVPVIGTTHIPRSDAQLLEELGSENPMLFPFSDAGSGYVLRIGEWQDPEYRDFSFSDAFNHICRTLAAKGWEYLRFDGAGDEFPDLPTFEW